MGLLSGLFGSKGGYSGKVKQQANSLYNQFGDVGDWFDPDQENALQMEGFDDALRGQEAAFGGGLLARGFRGRPSFGLGRARFAAGTRANTRQKARDWRLKGLQAQAGFFPQFAQMNYRQPSSGILPGLASLAGGFGLLGGGGGMSPVISESGNMGQMNGGSYDLSGGLPYFNPTQPMPPSGLGYTGGQTIDWRRIFEQAGGF